MPVHLDNDLSVIYWRPAFLVLGVRRCQPLLLQAGVPPEVAAAPEGLVKAAHHFFLAKDRLRSNDPESHRLDLIALLEDVFGMLSNSYGEPAAQSLYDWIQRHFVDQKQITCWSTWAALLSSSCTDDDTWSTDRAFLGDLASRIQSVAFQYFSPDAEAQIAGQLARARTIPLSRFEQGLVALEVTQPTDFRETDVVEVLERVLNNQLAYQAWSELDRQLSASDREAFIWWGYEQAAFLGIPAEDVIHPTRAS